ncbi:MAG: restriction endonuclease, partial [Candidatus Methanomethylophilaceae archaeon]|nr:restriction endonuclease [Candidatus Methanomethylophilaceae archaeon]
SPPVNVEGFEQWRSDLLETLQTMNPYSFEKLAQRLLRECGFKSVKVTKKSEDGGIDGFGKLKVNGMFCFNDAFQCKRYRGSVPASDIRDFRGSMTKSVEKGIFITTGSFSKTALDEAADPGKMQIDLIDGDDLVDKMGEIGLGLKRTYMVDREFFESLDRTPSTTTKHNA